MYTAHSIYNSVAKHLICSTSDQEKIDQDEPPIRITDFVLNHRYDTARLTIFSIIDLCS